MTVRWKTVTYSDGIYVALAEEKGRIIRRHPIPFESEKEADRAAARLNAAGLFEGS